MEITEDIKNNLLKKIIKKYHILKYDIKIEKVCNKGDNYVGVLKKVSIEGKVNTEKSIILKFIIKQAPTDKKWREMFNCEHCFNKEIHMYEDVLPQLTKLEEDYKLKDRLRLPSIHLISKQIGFETLIMEDLTFQGFEMKDRRYPLNLQHCKIVMRYLSKLHSLSFMLKKQKPELYSELSVLPGSLTKERLLKILKTGQAEEGFKRNTFCFDIEKDAHLISKVRHVYDNFVEITLFCLSEKNSNGYNVICHRDCWINNILFKYEKTSDKCSPCDVSLIDWQVSIHASPLIDILFFIYTSTDKELRDKHLDQLYEEYYTSLSIRFKNFGENVEEHFPKQEFLRHIQIFSKFGLIISLLVLIYTIRDPTECTDPVDMAQDPQDAQKKLTDYAFKDHNFQKRIRGIIEEMYEKKYV